MRIAAVGGALPRHYYDQDALIGALKDVWATRHHNVERLEQIHRNVLVGGRHLALPVDAYAKLQTFADANNAYIECAVDLGARAIEDGLQRAGLSVQDIDHIFFVTVTGLAVPSIDARIVNKLGLRPDVKRTPIFGLGCVAGAAGVARVADVLRGDPNGVAVLLSVELCSLTLQRQDLSVANIIASGLFGDGAAAAVVVGNARQAALQERADGAVESGTASVSPLPGPQIVATESVFYPNSEYVMGWDITQDGFKIVLSADVPKVVKQHIAGNVDAFLAKHGLMRRHIESYVCHPGGPKVLEAFEEALGISREALAVTWRSLLQVGNLSSTSVLLVLKDTMQDHRPAKGSYGLMMAMGPGFCSELVLLRW